jgi:hypothetical protein
MPQVGFETTIPVFEREKTVHALDCTATVVGCKVHLLSNNLLLALCVVCSFYKYGVAVSGCEYRRSLDW